MMPYWFDGQRGVLNLIPPPAAYSVVTLVCRRCGAETTRDTDKHSHVRALLHDCRYTISLGGDWRDAQDTEQGTPP